MVDGMFLLYIFIVLAKVSLRGVYVEKIKCTVPFALFGSAVWLGAGFVLRQLFLALLPRLCPYHPVGAIESLLGIHSWRRGVARASERVGCSAPTLWCAPQT